MNIRLRLQAHVLGGNMPQLPHHHPSHAQETASLRRLESLLPQDLFIIRSETGGDYGVDRILEVLEGGSATNVRSHLQIKSRQAKSTDRDFLTFSVPLKSLNYLLNTVNSIFAVYSIAEDVFYWEWTSVIAIAASQSGLNLSTTAQKSYNFKFVKRLTSSSAIEIHAKLIEDNSLIDGSNSNPGFLQRSASKSIPMGYQELFLLYSRDDFENVISLSRGLAEDSAEIGNLVALSHYKMRNLKEAHRVNLKVLEREPSNQLAIKVSAMILCEMGRGTNNRDLLERAKSIMLSLNRRLWRLDDYFNFGNMLSGLGEHKKAIKSYKRSIQLDPGVAVVWKNLAACYFYQGDHEEELRCLDKALELNSELVEALVSKANTLGEVFSKRREAVELIEKALLLSDKPYEDTSAIFYWLAHHLSELGEPGKALETIQKARKTHPDYRHLECLRIKILLKHWRLNDRLRQEAEDAINESIRADAKDFQLRNELVAILLEQSRESEAMELIIGTFRELDFNIKRICLERFSISQLTKLLTHLGSYLQFRKEVAFAKSFIEHFDANSGTLQAVEITYGIRFAKLIEIVRPGRKRADLSKDIDLFVTDFMGVFEECSRAVAVQYEKASIKRRSEIATELILGLPEFCLQEFWRQVSWTMRRAGYPATSIDSLSTRVTTAYRLLKDSLEPILQGVFGSPQ